MGSKKSSFHMGDEFNGKGEKVYLRATTHKTYQPLSQENVRLTPDFKQCVPKAVGAMPAMGSSMRWEMPVQEGLVPCQRL